MANYTIPTLPLKRLRYYNNQFLTEKDFIDDQAAHLAHERAHLRALCAPGVLEGMALTSPALPTDSPASVAPGVAVDDQGRLIVLNAFAAGPAPGTLGTGTFVVSIQYNEAATDMSTNTGGAAGTADNTRFTSQPAIAATAPNAVPASAVVVGTITVSATGQITARTDAGRQCAGLRMPNSSFLGEPAATLTSRVGGSSDAAVLSGSLRIQRSNGGFLSLMRPDAAPGTAGTGCSITFDPYDTGLNANSVSIRSSADGNFSSDLAILTKVPGAINNGLVERMRITSSGAVQFSGPVTAASLAISGAATFSGAVTTNNQIVSGNTGETNVAPLVLNRDYLNNNRSLIDHNGYRMGQVTELNETWLVPASRTWAYTTYASQLIGGSGGGYGVGGSPGALAINSSTQLFIISLVPQTTGGFSFTSGTVDVTRTNGTDNVAMGLTTRGPENVQFTIGGSSSGTGDTVANLTTSDGRPYHILAGRTLTLTVQGQTVTGTNHIKAIALNVITDPPGWNFVPDYRFAAPMAKRTYDDAVSGLNQRACHLTTQSSSGGAGNGVMTTEAFECFADADVCYVQEWMMKTGVITAATNNRTLALGIQNANAGANNRFVYFYNDSTMANWKVRIVGSSTTDAETGVALTANTVYRMQLEIMGANTSSAGSGAFRVRGYINGAKVTDLVINTLPTADLIRPYFHVGTTSANGGPFDYSVGRVRRVWNHRVSSDSL